MKNRLVLLLIGLAMNNTISAQVQNEGKLVLFDASKATNVSLSATNGATFKLDGGLLKITTVGNNEYPSVRIEGEWNISDFNQIEIELVNFSQSSLPVMVRLENANADPDNERGILLDRVSIAGGAAKSLTFPIPPKPPYPDVKEKLFGMRYTPYKLSGLVEDLDKSKVKAITVYLRKPKNDWEWAVKSVSATKGEPEKLVSWMNLPAEKFFPFIDKYGQFIHKDWPGKTKSDEELVESHKRELLDLESHKGPEDRSKFGGWKSGPREKATGHFYVKKIDGKWWMVDPEGYLFWSHGVVRVTPSTGVTPLDGRDIYFTDLPKENDSFAEFYKTHDELLYPYYVARGIKRTYDFSAANIKRKYGEDWRAEFASIAHIRLKSWGLNTIANSSDKAICMMDKTPYTDRIELKSPDIEGSRQDWWKFKDPFHPEFRKDFRRQLLERRKELDDPWCFGFFVDNEIAWGSSTALAEWTMQSPATQPAKIEMMKFLKKRYGSIQKLNSKWTTNYAGWDDLLKFQGELPDAAMEDCKIFTEVITEAYFKFVREEFKKVAPNKLYLGCRFARSNPIVLKIAAKYCDVISYNIYSRSLSTFSLPEGIDKPVMIGEFHFGALDRGLFHPGLVETANQQKRGEAYRVYVESALRHPNIIGTHWHQFSDQATTGRFDGENFQVGFTDVCDNPYPETIENIRKVGYVMYEIRAQK